MKKNNNGCYPGRQFFTLIILALIFIFLLSSSTRADIQKELKNILLEDGDVKGYKMESQVEVKNWPVVDRLPDYMKDPTRIEGTSPIDAKPRNIDDVPEMQYRKPTQNLDGIRQLWKESPGRQSLKVEYGIYDSPEKAKNALKYIVYNIYTRYLNDISQPVDDGQGKTIYRPMEQKRACKKIDMGDLGYTVPTYPFISVTYFVRGRYIFMVDGYTEQGELSVCRQIIGNLGNSGK